MGDELILGQDSRDDEQAKLLTFSLILWAKGQHQRSLDCLLSVSESKGEMWVFLMIADWIVSTQNMELDENLGFALVDERGNDYNPDEMFPDPASLEAATTWCLRFIAALGNGVVDQCQALLSTIEDKRIHASRVVAMLNIAGEIMRDRLILEREL